MIPPVDPDRLHPGQVVRARVPWGENKGQTTLVLARVVAVREKVPGSRGWASAKPVTVEWIGSPPIPGGHGRWNTFDFRDVFPVVKE